MHTDNKDQSRPNCGILLGMGWMAAWAAIFGAALIYVFYTISVDCQNPYSCSYVYDYNGGCYVVVIANNGTALRFCYEKECSFPPSDGREFNYAGCFYQDEHCPTPKCISDKFITRSAIVWIAAFIAVSTVLILLVTLPT